MTIFGAHTSSTRQLSGCWQALILTQLITTLQATFLTLAAKLSVRDSVKVRRLSMLVRQMKTSDKLPGLEGRNRRKGTSQKDYTFADLIQELEDKASVAM